MNFDFSNGNIDKCSIQGNCAQEPYANFINEYIMNEICDLIFYIQKLKKMNLRNELLEREIISFLAELNLNFEFQAEIVTDAIKRISLRKNEVEVFYNKTCKENNKYAKSPKNKLKNSPDLKISEIAQIGEQLFLKGQQSLSEEENTLYTIYLLLIKNLAKNINEILNLGYEIPEIIDKFFEACVCIRICQKSNTSYLKRIKDLYGANYDITVQKYSILIEKFGNIVQKNLSFSSRKNNCIMISGNSLKDLNDLLETLKDENIDVYTHNGMIYAHQYKKFARNSRLAGQYQKSADSIKYDFVTFPGPVIISSGQQSKFEGIYRGNLFTTNKIVPYGVRFIENHDYSKVIDVAKTTQGFKKDHKKESLKIGYNESEIDSFLYKLSQDIKDGTYKSVLFVGLLHNNIDNSDFYKQIAQNLKEKTFIISMAHELNLPNSKHFPSYYDYNLTLKIFNYLNNLKNDYDFTINVYITDCTSQIVPNIMMLNYFGVKNIFIPVCRKLPNTNHLEYILKRHFNTHITLYNPENDLRILNSKVL